MLALTRWFSFFLDEAVYLLLDKGEYLCLLPQHWLALTAALGVVHLGRQHYHLTICIELVELRNSETAAYQMTRSK